MSRITEPGIYHDFDVEEYHADPAPMPSLTQSIAKVLIEQAPAHAKVAHPRLAPPVDIDEPAEKYDAAKAIGNAAHALMLGRGKVLALADYDDWRKKEAQAFRAEAEAAGKVAILSKHYDRAAALVRAARLQLDAAACCDAFTNGKPEVVIAWQENGIWFRSMIDWLSEDRRVLWDFKSTGMSCAPHQIGAMIERAGWHIQAAMHERGLDVLDPVSAGRRRYRFAAIENEEPYALVPVELDEHWLTMGRKQLQHAVDVWTRCLKANAWPAYPAEIVRPEYPGYRETQWLAREIAESERHDHQGVRVRDNLIMAG